jgi:hypothetical protein
MDISASSARICLLTSRMRKTMRYTDGQCVTCQEGVGVSVNTVYGRYSNRRLMLGHGTMKVNKDEDLCDDNNNNCTSGME